MRTWVIVGAAAAALLVHSSSWAAEGKLSALSGSGWSLGLTMSVGRDFFSREVGKGMEAFRRGDVKGSLAAFDGIIEAEPRYAPYLWQRGLSLYYAEDFEGASQQFRGDAEVNPNDTEEAIWCMASEARRAGGLIEARSIQSPPVVGRDPRPYMRRADALFRGLGTEEALALEGGKGGIRENFYVNLYMGLYNEVENRPSHARHYIEAAVSSPYSSQVPSDYMVDVARIHKRLRGW